MQRSSSPSNLKLPNHAIWHFNDIQMGYGTTHFDSYKTSLAENNRDVVRLHFGLRGDYRFTYQELKKSYDLIGGHHNIMYSKGIHLEIENKTLDIETFGIEFPKQLFIQYTEGGDDLMKTFLEDIMEGKPTMLSKKWGTIKAPIQHVIEEVKSNSYTGSLEKIFLLSKSLELLVLCVDDYYEVSKKKLKYATHKKDRERLIAARDFVQNRVSNPPNLSEISKAVGLNEFKLKNGFKEMFGQTIFSYLTDLRLQRAVRFMLDTDKTAAEISYELGYSSPQHFNQQFKKHFGATPNSIRKNPAGIIQSGGEVRPFGKIIQ